MTVTAEPKPTMFSPYHIDVALHNATADADDTPMFNTALHLAQGAGFQYYLPTDLPIRTVEHQGPTAPIFQPQTATFTMTMNTAAVSVISA